MSERVIKLIAFIYYGIWTIDDSVHIIISVIQYSYIFYSNVRALKRLKLCKINKNIIGSTGSMETQCFRVRWPSDVDTVNVTSAWNIRRVYYLDRVTVPVHWLSFLYLPRQSRQPSLVSGRHRFRSVKFSLVPIFWISVFVTKVIIWTFETHDIAHLTKRVCDIRLLALNH